MTRISVTLTGRARQLRRNMTDAERRLWQYLRLEQIEGRRFRRQCPIGPYIVDFVCLDRRLIVEVDGGQHGEQKTADQQRTDWLIRQGYRVIRKPSATPGFRLRDFLIAAERQ